MKSKIQGKHSLPVGAVKQTGNYFVFTMMNDVLDQAISEKRGYREIILWWERKRPLYNMIMFFTGMPCLWSLWMMWKDVAFTGPGLLLLTGLYGLMANIFFTGGELFECLFRLATGKDFKGTYINMILFILGTLFSVSINIWIGFSSWLVGA